MAAVTAFLAVFKGFESVKSVKSVSSTQTGNVAEQENDADTEVF